MLAGSKSVTIVTRLVSIFGFTFSRESIRRSRKGVKIVMLSCAFAISDFHFGYTSRARKIRFNSDCFISSPRGIN